MSEPNVTQPLLDALIPTKMDYRGQIADRGFFIGRSDGYTYYLYAVNGTWEVHAPDVDDMTGYPKHYVGQVAGTVLQRGTLGGGGTVTWNGNTYVIADRVVSGAPGAKAIVQ